MCKQKTYEVLSVLMSMRIGRQLAVGTQVQCCYQVIVKCVSIEVETCIATLFKIPYMCINNIVQHVVHSSKNRNKTVQIVGDSREAPEKKNERKH